MREYGITTSQAHYWYHFTPKDMGFWFYRTPDMMAYVDTLPRSAFFEADTHCGWRVPLKQAREHGVVDFDRISAAVAYILPATCLERGNYAEQLFYDYALTRPAVQGVVRYDRLEEQYEGKDFRVMLRAGGCYDVEVKFDGPGGLRGTGNLYVQFQERRA